MKIEKLTENKIRIILNIDELNEKNIDFLSLTQNTEETQKLFKKILKQAEKEVDFQIEDSKLLIEAFVSSDGFFIITFTKITSEYGVPIGNPLKLRVKKKNTSISSTKIYEFNVLDEFNQFCTYLKHSSLGDLHNLAKQISLHNYKGKYFLVFSNINYDFENFPLFLAIISEFAKLHSNSSVFTNILLEYGKTIFKTNAIKLGMQL